VACIQQTRWRSTTRDLDVLLLDAEHRQTLAAMRVFARAGLHVGAVACEADADWAPSLRSRFCAMSASVPDFTSDAEGYVTAILQLLDEHPVRMVMPAHDGSIHALRLRRAEIERRTVLPLASESALDIAISKRRTLALGAELGLAVPRSVPVNDISDVAAAMNEVGFPAVLKPCESWVEREGKGVRLSPKAVLTLDDARRSLEQVLQEGGRALLQNWLPGRREAVTLFYARGRFWGRLAQTSYREWPVLGGASVLCETIPLLADITTASESLVRAINLEGCSMVEFRRDQHGRPVLMEVNPRLGGSVALAISAGVNFPKLMYDWSVGQLVEEPTTYRVGKRLRWLAGDLWNLKCAFQNQTHPDIPPRFTAVATFLADFSRPNHVGGIEFGDLRPALAEMNKIVSTTAVGARALFLRKLVSERPTGIKLRDVPVSG
jgi:predicted ATP-grasp superfamily ATP-dependent carboligase